MVSKKEIIKGYLEDWQYFQHMEDFEASDRIEKILLEQFDINMNKDWIYWLEKYQLIQ